MELAGICDIIHDYRIQVALAKGYRVFRFYPFTFEEMRLPEFRRRVFLKACLNRPMLW